MLVDWRDGAKPPRYDRAAANTRLVGRQVARMIQEMEFIFNDRSIRSRTHIIGFSLGAHAAGNAGMYIRQNPSQAWVLSFTPGLKKYLSLFYYARHRNSKLRDWIQQQCFLKSDYLLVQKKKDSACPFLLSKVQTIWQVWQVTSHHWFGCGRPFFWGNGFSIETRPNRCLLCWCHSYWRFRAWHQNVCGSRWLLSKWGRPPARLRK